MLGGRLGLARLHGDADVLHQGLLALRAVVFDADQHIHLGHVSRGATLRQVVSQRMVLFEPPVHSRFGGRGDIHEVALLDTAGAHVVGVHEDQRAQVLDASVTVVIRVDRGVPLIVRAHGLQNQRFAIRYDVGHLSVREVRVAGGRLGEI